MVLDVVLDELAEIDSDLAVAVNHSEVALAAYEEVATELESVTEQYMTALDVLRALEEEYASTPAEDQNKLDTREKKLKGQINALNTLNESKIELQEEANNLFVQVNSTSLTVESITVDFNEKEADVLELKDVLQQKEDNVNNALHAFQRASEKYNNALLDYQTRSVPTFVQCMHDGSWYIPGNPYCVGKWFASICTVKHDL